MQLSQFNQHRLLPGYIQDDWSLKIQQELNLLLNKSKFIESERQHVKQYLVHMSHNADLFKHLLENLKTRGVWPK